MNNETGDGGATVPCIDLLDCPFCGAEGVLRPWHPKGHADKLWRAECSSFDCQATIGPYPDPDFTREQWNRRKSNAESHGRAVARTVQPLVGASGSPNPGWKKMKIGVDINRLMCESVSQQRGKPPEGEQR